MQINPPTWHLKLPLFSPEGSLVDTDGKLVMRWVWQVAT